MKFYYYNYCLTLLDNNLSPFFPSTYKVVFNASIGIKSILNPPAVADAVIVFNAVGNFFEYSKLSINSKIAVLAKVSKIYKNKNNYILLSYLSFFDQLFHKLEYLPPKRASGP